MTQSTPDRPRPPLKGLLPRRLRRMLGGIYGLRSRDARRRALAGAADRVLSLGPIKRRTNPNLRARVALTARRASMDDVEQLYEFWRQESPDGNYFTPSVNSTRSETILRIMAERLEPSHSILEIGCNVGRNLNHLWSRGFKNLAGLEISEPAIQRLRASYPNLRETPIMLGPAELLLPGLPDGSFDLVFTMAVLEHVHPSQSAVFREIARVSRRYVLAIEPRAGTASHRQYPWDFVRCFEEVGLRVIHQANWSSLWPTPSAEDPEWDRSHETYEAWVFEAASGESALS